MLKSSNMLKRIVDTFLSSLKDAHLDKTSAKRCTAFLFSIIILTLSICSLFMSINLEIFFALCGVLLALLGIGSKYDKKIKADE